MFGCDAELMTATLQRVVENDGPEMASVESELTDGYPDVAPGVIHTLVQQAYERMTPAKVHMYLPILIGREVRYTLRADQAA
jgi:hypothetical protein